MPAATALRADVASVVMGISDTLGGGFDPARTACRPEVAVLQEAGAQVLTMRLPGPGQMFGLAGALAGRMCAVNAVVGKVA